MIFMANKKRKINQDIYKHPVCRKYKFLMIMFTLYVKCMHPILNFHLIFSRLFEVIFILPSYYEGCFLGFSGGKRFIQYHFLKSQCKLVLLQRSNRGTSGHRKPKTNFVEVRTFWHLYRSFDRMWIFFILAFQVA